MAINVNDVSKFRFIAHKVMPLVFDESLSYYEFLCKVLQKMNEVIDNENDQNQALEDFDAEMTRFEGAMGAQYDAFAAEIGAAIDAFEASEIAARGAFETAITTQQNNYETAITAQQNSFESEITNQQETFETSINADFQEFFDDYLQTLGIEQTTGTSTTKVMSQKAVTDELANVVSFTTEQSKTTAEKNQAQKNIGIESALPDIGQLQSAFNIVEGNNILDTSNLESGYVNPSTGQIMPSDTQSHTDFIPVTAGETYVFSANASTSDLGTIRWSRYYASTTPIQAGGTVGASTYDAETNRYYGLIEIPAGSTAFIIISASTDNIWNNNLELQLEEGTTPTTYIPFGGTITLKDNATPSGVLSNFDSIGDEIDDINDDIDDIKEEMSYIKESDEITADLLEDEDELILPLIDNSLKKSFTLNFRGTITSFNSIKLGSTNTYAVVNDTNIIFTANNVTQTSAHGLTISNNINLSIKFNGSEEADVILVSDGELYTHTFTNYKNKAKEQYSIYSDESELTNCKLSWFCCDIKKDIWIFGDSYLGYTDNRWLYYLAEEGYDKNALIDAYPGESGAISVSSFENLLQFGKPKIAVYMLGMNDGNDGDVSPSTWRTPRETFVTLCNNNGITPVFALIPSVPTIKHEQKNNWVLTNNYRYIDFYNAVGSNSSGTWYTGMLSSDNIHP